MPLFGSVDQSNNSPLYTPAQLSVTANVANRDKLYGNTTSDGYVPGRTDGVFGVDSSEISALGSVVSIQVTFPGSGYSANATVTVDGNATANTTANSTGRISAVNVTDAGNTYAAAPSVVIADSPAHSFNSNTAVNANGFIGISSNVLQDGDEVTYLVAAGNTAIAELTDGQRYIVDSANSTGVYLKADALADVLTLTKGLSESGHSLTGQTATAEAVISGGRSAGVTHTGWHLRTVGSGGRAGRINYECLVAGGISGDASDDTILPDS